MKRNKEQGLERMEFNATSLWSRRPRAGWAKKGIRRNSLPASSDFCPSYSYKQMALAPCKLFWIFTLYRVDVCVLQRPRKRQGGNGSLALEPATMKFLKEESFT